MGRDYDSAVMASGFVGFALGTTANAVANMRALVTKYGPAPRAFLVVPLVGAFFIDFANAIIITLLRQLAALSRVLLATCRTKPALTASDARLAAELERLGAETAARPWDAIPPGGEPGAIVCLRSTWDYHRRWAEFRSWVAGFDARAGTLWNPPETVLWNADKRYLSDLSAAGIAVPRTRWLEPGERPDCDGILREWKRGSRRPEAAGVGDGVRDAR